MKKIVLEWSWRYWFLPLGLVTTQTDSLGLYSVSCHGRKNLQPTKVVLRHQPSRGPSRLLLLVLPGAWVCTLTSLFISFTSPFSLRIYGGLCFWREEFLFRHREQLTGLPDKRESLHKFALQCSVIKYCTMFRNKVLYYVVCVNITSRLDTLGYDGLSKSGWMYLVVVKVWDIVH